MKKILGALALLVMTAASATISDGDKYILNNYMGKAANQVQLGTQVYNAQTASVPAADSITAAMIQADAVGTSEIAADAVTSSEIATDAVGTAEIAALAVDTAEIAAGAVNQSKMNQVWTASGLYVPRVAIAVIDFSDISAASNTSVVLQVPSKAIVQNCWYEVLTTFTSSSDAATIGFGIQAANDEVTAVAISDGANPWDAGFHNCTTVPQTATTFVKTTAAKDLSITRGGAQVLTAGKMRVVLSYVVSE